MTSIVRKKNRNTTVTHWAKSGKDKYGNPSFSSPAEYDAYWEDTNEITTDAQGQQIVSEAMVILDQDLNVGDFLYKGSSANSKPVSGSYEIKKFIDVPGLGDRSEKKAVL